MFKAVLLSLSLALAGPAGSPGGTPKKQASQFNTQVNLQEESEGSMTVTVKVLREVQGDAQVFFEGKTGAYQLDSAATNYGSMQSRLANSQKKKIPVSVRFNSDTMQILSVTPAEGE